MTGNAGHANLVEGYVRGVTGGINHFTNSCSSIVYLNSSGVIDGTMKLVKTIKRGLSGNVASTKHQLPHIGLVLWVSM
ncbi:hypothetical protein D3C72_2460330 [compost metagenome]